jgi:hypothetical protein
VKRLDVCLCLLGAVLLFASDARMVGAAPDPCDSKCECGRR